MRRKGPRKDTGPSKQGPPGDSALGVPSEVCARAAFVVVYEHGCMRACVWLCARTCTHVYGCVSMHNVGVVVYACV